MPFSEKKSLLVQFHPKGFQQGESQGSVQTILVPFMPELFFYAKALLVFCKQAKKNPSTLTSQPAKKQKNSPVQQYTLKTESLVAHICKYKWKPHGLSKASLHSAVLTLLHYQYPSLDTLNTIYYQYDCVVSTNVCPLYWLILYPFCICPDLGGISFHGLLISTHCTEVLSIHFSVRFNIFHQATRSLFTKTAVLLLVNLISKQGPQFRMSLKPYRCLEVQA